MASPPFPYGHTQPNLITPNQMLENLTEYKPVYSNSHYWLKSYYPKYRRRPNTYRGTYCSMQSGNKLWWEFDCIADFYTECVRVHVKRDDAEYTPYEYWTKFHEEIIQLAKDEGVDVDHIIYRKTKGAGILRPSWIKFILRSLFGNVSLEGKRMLNPSAGWGNCLISAIACGMSYTGADPNLNLKEGHTRIINELGNPDKHQVIYKPFEDVDLTQKYDIVLWSPPFFTLEQYSNHGEQSVIRYPEFEQWMTEFLFVATKKAFDSLSKGGYMAIYIADSYYHNFCDPLCDYVATLDNSIELGVLGIAGGAKKYRPVWIWQKL